VLSCACVVIVSSPTTAKAVICFNLLFMVIDFKLVELKDEIHTKDIFDS